MMGSGDHFGAEAEANMLRAEERLNDELNRRERCAAANEQRDEEQRRRRQAYEAAVLKPRGRRLFVFTGCSETVFDPEHYRLAVDKDIRRDPLVKRLARELEEMRAQLPVRRMCSRCGASRVVDCFSQDESICDRCHLASLSDGLNEEHLARSVWQDKATQVERELREAKESCARQEELALKRAYENDQLKNELLNKTLALKLTTEALQFATAYVRSQPHKLTCPKSGNPKSPLDCNCGIDLALGLRPERKLT